MRYIIVSKVKYFYVGNCIDSFEEIEGLDECINNYLLYNRASDFAYDEENAKKISEKDFFRLVDDHSMLNKKDKHIYFISKKKVLMAYNTENDVHYFFIKG